MQNSYHSRIHQLMGINLSKNVEPEIIVEEVKRKKAERKGELSAEE